MGVEGFTFAEMWQQAIDNDPYWQFEELLEEDPELAEYLWDCQRIAILVEKRLNAGKTAHIPKTE